MNTPTKKKQKLVLCDVVPGIPKGAMSASAAVSGKFLPLKIWTQTETDATYFFDKHEFSSEEDLFKSASNTNNIKTELIMSKFESDGNNKTTELRDHISTELRDNHGIQFLVEKESDEIDLETLFKLAEDKLVDPKCEDSSMDKEEKGLLVTTTLLPNLPTHCGNLESLKMGDLKNGKNYNTEHVEQQCLHYMYSHLYWLRVKLGRKATTVYGFGICGCNCLDHKKGEYSIGLFELNAPRYLGEIYNAKTYWFNSSTSDEKGLKLLIHFLKNGKGTVFSSKNDSFKDPLPSFFVTPVDFWEPLAEHDYELVRNGTRAIVFRVKSLKGLELIANNFRKSLDDYAVPQWDKHFEAILSTRSPMIQYIKIVTRDCKYDVGTGVPPFHSLWSDVDNCVPVLRDEVKQTYPVKPFFHAGDATLYLMNDRGEKVGCDTFKSFNEVVQAFLPIQTISEQLIKRGFVHTDLQLFNLVASRELPRSLHLIDLDEIRYKRAIPKRHIDGKLWQNDIGWAMYPNAICHDAKMYNTIQLAFTLNSLLALLPEDIHLPQICYRLNEALQTLGKGLREKESRDNLKIMAEMVRERMEELLQGK